MAGCALTRGTMTADGWSSTAAPQLFSATLEQAVLPHCAPPCTIVQGTSLSEALVLLSWRLARTDLGVRRRARADVEITLKRDRSNTERCACAATGLRVHRKR